MKKSTKASQRMRMESESSMLKPKGPRRWSSHFASTQASSVPIMGAVASMVKGYHLGDSLSGASRGGLGIMSSKIFEVG